MNFFTFDLRKVFLVLALVVIPLLAVNMQRKSEEELWFSKPFSWSAGMVQSAYAGFSSGVRGTTADYINIINVKTQNRKLTSELMELKAQLGAMTELKLENERLNGLLGFKQATKMELRSARVVGHDLLPDHNTITIDRGSNDGVRKNMAALTIGGVVGYIFRVEPQTSQVLLLTDRYAVIDSIVQRSRARGLVEGLNKESCRLRYLKRNDDIKVGDLVVTSGLFNVFPKGYPIGTVSSVVKTQYGMTQEVELTPAVEPANLEELFVVLSSNNENFLKEEPKDVEEGDPE
jgi:rod shape-determining protein MreC